MSERRHEPCQIAVPRRGQHLLSGARACLHEQGNDILESLAKEGETMELDTSSSRPAAIAATIAASASSDPVTLVVEEKLSVTLNKQVGREAAGVSWRIAPGREREEGGGM